MSSLDKKWPPEDLIEEGWKLVRSLILKENQIEKKTRPIRCILKTEKYLWYPQDRKAHRVFPRHKNLFLKEKRKASQKSFTQVQYEGETSQSSSIVKGILSGLLSKQKTVFKRRNIF